LSPTGEFFSKVVPYPVSPCLGNLRVFFGPIVLSQSSGRNDIISEDEDKLSSMYSIPLQRWIDHSCGYTFRQDDRVDDFSF
jgi:hypothetical protein